MKIYKYPLTIPTTKINLSVDSQILSVHEQHGIAMLWVRNSDHNVTKERTFIAYLTGEEISPCVADKFIGTILLDNGTFVLHIFELINV